MKRINLFFLSLLATLLVTTNAWGATATETLKASTTLPSQGTPEYQYKVIGAVNGKYWAPTMASRDEAQAALFAFYAVEDKDDTYYIYDMTARKWLSYESASGYNAGANKITLSDTKDHYFKATHHDNAAGQTNTPCYSFSPYKTDGTAASMFFNWHGGANNSNVMGYYGSNGANDGGSAWAVLQENTKTKALAKVVELKKVTAIFAEADCDAATSALNALTGDNLETEVNRIMDALYHAAESRTYRISCDTRATGRYMKFLSQESVSISTTEDNNSLIKLYYLGNGGFAISGFNQARYLKAPSSRNGNVTTSTSSADAATYFFSYNETAGTNNDHINICCPASSTGYYYLHDANGTTICEWNAGGSASKWSVQAVDGYDFTTGKVVYINSGRGDSYYFKNTGSRIHLNGKEETNAFRWFIMKDPEDPTRVNLYNLSDNSKWGWSGTAKGSGLIQNGTGLIGYSYALVPSGNDSYPYALLTSSNSLYVSNYGGYTNDLGLYDKLNDAGTRFKVVSADADVYTLKLVDASGNILNTHLKTTATNALNANSFVGNGQYLAINGTPSTTVADYAFDSGYDVSTVTVVGKTIVVVGAEKSFECTVNIFGCKTGKVVYDGTEYGNGEKITVTGSLGTYTVKDIDGYNHFDRVASDQTQITAYYHVSTPVDGKAYKIYNLQYQDDNQGPLWYMNYTYGQVNTIADNVANATSFLVQSTGKAVSGRNSYWFRAADGKYLVWLGGADGYLVSKDPSDPSAATESRGYALTRDASQGDLTDWTEIQLTSNSKLANTLSLIGRRSTNSYSPFIFSSSKKFQRSGVSDEWYVAANSSVCYLVEDDNANIIKVQYKAYKSDGTTELGELPAGVGAWYKYNENDSVDVDAVMPYWLLAAGHTFDATNVSAIAVAGYAATKSYNSETKTVTISYRQDAQFFDFTYEYTIDGNAVYSHTYHDVKEGTTFPTVESVDYYTSNPPASIYEGGAYKTVTAGGTYTITMTVTDPSKPFPFKFSTTADPTWYYIKMRPTTQGTGKTDFNYAYYDENSEVATKQTPTSETLIHEDEYRWAFVGSPFGFNIINRAAGSDKALYTTQEGSDKYNNYFITPTAEAPATEYVTLIHDKTQATSQTYAGDIYIKIKGTDNYYINRNGGFYYWNNSSAKGESGSAMAFIEYDPGVELNTLISEVETYQTECSSKQGWPGYPTQAGLNLLTTPLQNAKNATTVAEKETAITNLDNAFIECKATYNTPVAGTFYRLRSAYTTVGNYYVTCDSLVAESGDLKDRAVMITDAANTKTIYKYTDESKFVSYYRNLKMGQDTWTNGADGCAWTYEKGNKVENSLAMKNNTTYLWGWAGANKTISGTATKAEMCDRQGQADGNGHTDWFIEPIDANYIYTVSFSGDAVPAQASVKLGEDRAVTPAIVETNPWIYSETAITEAGQLTVAAVTDYNTSVTFDENDAHHIIVTYTYTRVKADDIEAAQTVYNTNGKIGYPASGAQVTTDLNTAIATANGVTTWNPDAYKALKEKVDAYKAETTVVLPTTGKVYTFKGLNDYYAQADGSGYVKTSLTVDNKSYWYVDESSQLFGYANQKSVSGNTFTSTATAVTFGQGKNFGKLYIKAGTGQYPYWWNNGNGTDLLGNNASEDQHTDWTIEELSSSAYYTINFVDAPEGATITYGGATYVQHVPVIVTDNTIAAGDITPSTVEGYISSVAVNDKVITVTYKALLSEGLYYLTNTSNNCLSYDGTTYSTTIAAGMRDASCVFYINGNTVKAQGQTVSDAFTYKSDGKLYKGDVAYTPNEVDVIVVKVNGDPKNTARKYATFCAPFAVRIPASFDAYTAVVNTSKKTITLNHYTDITETKEGKEVEAGIPVMLHSKDYSSSTFTVTPYIAKDAAYLGAVAPQDAAENAFKGTYAKTLFSELSGENYVLGASNNVIGFYKMKDNANLRANSAYVQITTTPSQDGNAKGFSISFEDDPTGINDVDANADVDMIYNLGGQKLNKLQKGINIVNGKKVLY